MPVSCQYNAKRAAEYCGQTFVSQSDEGGLCVASQARQSYGNCSCNRISRVEDNQPKRSTPDEDVGTPSRAVVLWWANDPQSSGCSQLGPVCRGESASTIDVGNPAVLR